jgi:hypothetical protein
VHRPAGTVVAAVAIASSAIAAALPAFEPVQPDLLGTGGTFVNAFADVDADADLDLFVGFNGAPNRLYRNDAGRLVDVAAAVGLADARPTRAAAWGDFDADGDADLLAGFAPAKDSASVLHLYRNDKATFSDVTAASGLTLAAGAVRQPVWIDFDDDGDLDLFVAFRDRPNAMFLNDAGGFRDIAPAVALADSRRSVGAVWFDYEQDGDFDLIVGNMDGDANGLFRNDAGRFTDVAEAAGVAWGGRAPKDPANGTVRPCVADVNGDGRFDLFFANYGPNGLFLDAGNGRFTDVSKSWGVAIDGRYDTCALADVDNDGRIDVYVNGTVTGGKNYPDFLFKNTGASFADETPSNIRALEADHGAQWADFDRDGDVDLALTGAQATGMHLLMRNMLPATEARQSLHVRIVGRDGRLTHAGAEVSVFAAGSRQPLATVLADSGSGYNAQSVMPVSLGLAARARVDVVVTWPGKDRRVRLTQTDIRPSGQTITILVDR